MEIKLFSITKNGKVVTNKSVIATDILMKMKADGIQIKNIIEDMTLEEMVLGNNMKKVGSIDRNGYFHSKESKIYDTIEDEEPGTGGSEPEEPGTGGSGTEEPEEPGTGGSDGTFTSYKFGMLADTHIDGDSDDESNSQSDMKKAINFMNKNADMICIAGDVGRDGREADYKVCQKLFASLTIPYHAARGNHDNYQSNSKALYKKYLGLEDDYVVEKEGDIFIFLSMKSKEYKKGGFDSGTLDWLEQQLNKYKNKRKFLIYHVFVPGTSGNAGGKYSSLMDTSNSLCKRFMNLIKSEDNLIFCNGHSHLYFKMADKYSNANYYHKSGECHYVHTPSATRPRDSSGANALELGQCYLVEVKADKVVFRAYDIVKAKFLPDYDFTVNVANVQ